MRPAVRIVSLMIIVLPALCSCRAISSVLHDDEKIAKAGSEILYRSELEQFIPNGISPEDSMTLARQYIDSWASDVIFLNMAEYQLTKEDKDVSVELEEYRKALLKYRYEQLYINERLDTAVTEAQIEEYYGEHKENYILRVPIVKARFMRISPDSPNLELLKKKISSSSAGDLLVADSLAYSSAEKFTIFSDNWIDMVTLADEFGTDYGTLLSEKKGPFIEIPDDYGKLNIAYLADFIGAGEVAPVEYCRASIKDVIISVRKHKLASTLEQELLEDARSKGQYVVY